MKTEYKILLGVGGLAALALLMSAGNAPKNGEYDYSNFKPDLKGKKLLPMPDDFIMNSAAKIGIGTGNDNYSIVLSNIDDQNRTIYIRYNQNGMYQIKASDTDFFNITSEYSPNYLKFNNGYFYISPMNADGRVKAELYINGLPPQTISG
jgi:hypothetical protein